MSARFANDRRAELAALCAAALLLAACGGSAPTRRAEEATAIEAVAPTASQSAATASADEGRTAEEPSRRTRRARAGQSSADEPLAVAEVPEYARQSYERALAAMARESWIEAELELEQLLLEYGGFAGPHVNLAIVRMQDGRDDEARAALDAALALNPLHAAANNQLGILLRKQGEFAAAETAYRRALETDPQYGLAHYNLGVLLDLYLRRQAEALEHYEFYQNLLGEPDQQVGRWIIDLRRRLGVTGNAASVVREDGP